MFLRISLLIGCTLYLNFIFVFARAHNPKLNVYFWRIFSISLSYSLSSFSFLLHPVFFAQFMVFLAHGISAGLLSRPHAIHWINLYPLNNTIGFPDTYLLDSDLSGGKCYPCFDQLGLGKKECL